MNKFKKKKKKKKKKENIYMMYDVLLFIRNY